MLPATLPRVWPPGRRPISRAWRGCGRCCPRSWVRSPPRWPRRGRTPQRRRSTAWPRPSPPRSTPDDEGFADAVWGAIELHRTSLAWPLLRVWTTVRPDSSPAWTMTGWALLVDGQRDEGVRHLRRALELDPDNGDAALMLDSQPS